jgi:hypothetical protein
VEKEGEDSSGKGGVYINENALNRDKVVWYSAAPSDVWMAGKEW